MTSLTLTNPVPPANSALSSFAGQLQLVPRSTVCRLPRELRNAEEKLLRFNVMSEWGHGDGNRVALVVSQSRAASFVLQACMATPNSPIESASSDAAADIPRTPANPVCSLCPAHRRPDHGEAACCIDMPNLASFSQQDRVPKT